MSYQSKYLDKANHYREVRLKKKLLGTFGFRGVVNDTITAGQAFRFGSALGRYLWSKEEVELLRPEGGGGKDGTAGPPGGRPALPSRTVAVAQDVRTSSDMLKCALASGMMQHGVHVLDLGIIPPGGLSREVQIREAHAGIMITASHNPPRYNGIKVYNGAGRGFTPDQDLQFEGFYFAKDAGAPPVPAGSGGPPGVGVMRTVEGVLADYASSMSEFVSGLYPSGQGRKVVVDGGGGNASKVTPKVLRDFDCEVVEFNCEYDGEFTTRPSEPTPANLSRLAELVVESGADFGAGHDGDSDRTNFIDEKGGYIQGDRTAAMLLVELFRNMAGKVDAAPLIPVNVAFSNILQDLAPVEGFEVLYTPVGEPAIAEAMHMYNAALGAEEMGSLVIRDWSWSREGPALVPIMAGLLNRRGMSLSEMDASFPRYHQVKSGMEMEPGVFSAVKDSVAPKLVEMDLGAKSVIDIDGVRVFMDDGWFMVRASGTEPKFRVFSESKDEDRARALNDKGHEILKACME